MARRSTATKTNVEYSQSTTYRRSTSTKAEVEYTNTLTYRRSTATKLMLEYEIPPIPYPRITSSKLIVEYSYQPFSPIKPYKKFLISVADVYAYDSSGNLVLSGKTMMDTGIELSLSVTDVYGDRGAPTEFVYFSEPDLTITIEDSQFNLAMISATTGKDIETGSDIYEDERVVIEAGGIGEVSKTPIANGYAWITLPNGTFERSLFTGNQFTSTATEGSVVDVLYLTNVSTAEVITIDGEIDPMEVYLVLEATLAIGDRTYNEFGKIQVEKLKAILSGNFILTMSPDGVSSTDIEARALSYDTYESGVGYYSIYGTIKETIPFRNWYDEISGIYIANGDFSLASGSTKQLVVKAIPNTGAAFSPPISDIEFTSDNPPSATVNSSGLVTGISVGNSGIRARVINRREMTDVVVATIT